MTIIDRLYASSGPEAIIDTVQIVIGDDVSWLVRGYFDIEATLEDGTTQTFTATDMDVALPARNADGTQDLKYAIDNIDGKASAAIKQALENRSSMTITYRKYVSDDLNAPQESPLTLTIKSGSFTATEVQASAGYMSLLDWSWPRNLYNLIEHPGLRYIS